MKAMKKLLSVMLVALLLVSVMPTAFAATYYKLNAQLVIDDQVVATETLSYVAEGEAASMSSKMVKLNAQSFWADYFNQYEFVSAESVSVDSMSEDVTVKVVLKSKECAHANKTTTVTNATCVAAGATVVTCDDCATVISSTPIAATGAHTFANGACSVCGAADPDYVAVPGDLIVYVMTRTYNETDDSYTEYADANGGQAVVIKEAAESSLTKALAESVVGSQLLDYKWQGGDVDADGNKTVNLLATILQTAEGKKVYQLQIIHNNGTSNKSYIDIYEGEGILAAIKNASFKAPSYEDHVLVGYSLKMTATADSSINIYHVASADMADAYGYIKVYCDWEEETDDEDVDYEYGEGGGLYGDSNEDPIYDVTLKIYYYGKTSSPAKTVSASSMGTYTKDGKLTQNEAQLVVQKYFKTTSETKYYGLFTTKTWDKGDYDVDYAVSSVELDPDNNTTVYVVVKNATAYVADTTNPKTGDGIVVALAAMMSTGGAALALGKKKFF